MVPKAGNNSGWTEKECKDHWSSLLGFLCFTQTDTVWLVDQVRWAIY